jgi:hypothetical protein
MISIVNILHHHRRRHDETSARSACQLRKVNLRWLREIGMATFQHFEGMPQESTDVIVNIEAVE